MNILIWLLDKWDARCRDYDVAVLWPACKKAAGDDLPVARSAFIAHALRDSAWRRIGPKKTLQRVMELE